MTPSKLRIILDCISFLLVTVDLFGSARIERLQRRIRLSAHIARSRWSMNRMIEPHRLVHAAMLSAAVAVGIVLVPPFKWTQTLSEPFKAAAGLFIAFFCNLVVAHWAVEYACMIDPRNERFLNRLLRRTLFAGACMLTLVVCVPIALRITGNVLVGERLTTGALVAIGFSGLVPAVVLVTLGVAGSLLARAMRRYKLEGALLVVGSIIFMIARMIEWLWP